MHTTGHSITSSARASTVAGRSRPSALAVLRLITRAERVLSTFLRYIVSIVTCSHLRSSIRIFILNGCILRFCPKALERPSIGLSIPWPNPEEDRNRPKMPGDVKRGWVIAGNVFLSWPVRVRTELAAGEHALQCPALNRAHRGAGENALRCPALNRAHRRLFLWCSFLLLWCSFLRGLFGGLLALENAPEMDAPLAQRITCCNGGTTVAPTAKMTSGARATNSAA